MAEQNAVATQQGTQLSVAAQVKSIPYCYNPEKFEKLISCK